VKREQGIELEYEVEIWGANESASDRVAVSQPEHSDTNDDSGKEK
jgi:hypothetical protein